MYNLTEKKPVSCRKWEALGGENVVDAIQCFSLQKMQRCERLLFLETVSVFISAASNNSDGGL